MKRSSPMALVVSNSTPEDKGADTAFISLQDAGKIYQTRTGKVIAVEAASFDLARGETLALLGPSGCGKSTLLMMIAGLLEASSGRILVNGRPLAGPIPELGFVFQRDLLLDWRSVLDNVLLPYALIGQDPRAHVERARSLLNRVGLGGFEDKRPYELSGGMRQRVAICRALIDDPDIFLLDEPFAALDAFTREQMQLDMQRLSLEKPRTTILVTHEIPEAVFMADRIAVMTARPSQIQEIVDIDLPRPRNMKTRESEAFGRYVTKIHGMFANLGVIHG
jgi:NitT/TauT family transport system ATP-binding protein